VKKKVKEEKREEGGGKGPIRSSVTPAWEENTPLSQRRWVGCGLDGLSEKIRSKLIEPSSRKDR